VKLLKISSFLLCFIITILFVLLSTKNYKDPSLFIIENGESLTSISNNLFDKGYIINSNLFKLYCYLSNRYDSLKAGEYLLKNESIISLNRKLFLGEIYYRKLTLVEGMSLADISLLILSHKALVQDLDLTKEAEGSYLPDTYFYKRGDRLSSILMQAKKEREKTYNNIWLTRSDNLPLKTLQEAVSLASIVEKEGSEKKQIASVFLNRLTMNMKLQADPTVIFAMGNQYKGNIRRKDLKLKHPYNTYYIKGLPPGPIGLVSETALEAVLNPIKTDKLYFVAKGDGSHVFTSNLEDHNAAVTKYQLKK
tara:strand:- start:8223 stop:9146 length:924 start_codon:yes stop_codon:yes gene_type:complete